MLKLLILIFSTVLLCDLDKLFELLKPFMWVATLIDKLLCVFKPVEHIVFFKPVL